MLGKGLKKAEKKVRAVAIAPENKDCGENINSFSPVFFALCDCHRCCLDIAQRAVLNLVKLVLIVYLNLSSQRRKTVAVFPVAKF